ncbi:hypothetical protein CR152_32190 (plasmid) [Massilia violaceinigra]|uniref:Uncharacterized protein n=1 Tax=Massilia violaceinigra TaxID=2045208 RepID=A0A2D2DW94_9BURK|nr:hypothetical protein CR152_32190 [Massilia violaceinigra]
MFIKLCKPAIWRSAEVTGAPKYDAVKAVRLTGSMGSGSFVAGVTRPLQKPPAGLQLGDDMGL